MTVALNFGAHRAPLQFYLRFPRNRG